MFAWVKTKALCGTVLGLCLAFWPLAGGAAPLETLRIGVLDYSGADHSLSHWQPTETALNAALPDYRFELVPLGIAALEKAVADNQLDFVITNPGDYAVLEYRDHISRLATAEDDIPVGSTLVTTGDLKKLGDLSGKRLAIVAPEAFGGFEVIWAQMHSLDPGLRARVRVVIAGYPMQKVADAVLSGDAEAGVLRACMLEQLQAANPARYGALHAFALQPSAETDCAVSSPVYPGWPFAKTRRADPELAKRVAVALLEMRQANLWTVPLDYQPVHTLMRELRIGPYKRTGPVSISEFVQDYRDWLIGFGVALVFWALYSVRIETLVRRRTQALDAANAGLKREMSERLRAEEADRLHLRELEHVARLSILGEMASSIAHELNQPLSAIANYSQGVLMRLRSGKYSAEEMERAASEIAQQAERAGTVIKRIRAFVRKRESQVGAVDMALLLRESGALFAAAVHRAGVAVDMDVAEDLPQVRADRVQLQQVILNLVQNGIDAMAETAPESRRLVVRSAPAADSGKGAGLCFSVRDYGTGLDAEAMAHFAEAFYTTKPDGIGLGLSLSRSIVEAHGGWLRAETPDDGPGLRVRVWLPEMDKA